MTQKVTMDFAGRPLTLETGRLARLAESAVLVSYGETVVLVTVTVSPDPVSMNFLPLRGRLRREDVRHRAHPRRFFKREGRPRRKPRSSAAVLTAPSGRCCPKAYATTCRSSPPR